MTDFYEEIQQRAKLVEDRISRLNRAPGWGEREKLMDLRFELAILTRICEEYVRHMDDMAPLELRRR